MSACGHCLHGHLESVSQHIASTQDSLLITIEMDGNWNLESMQWIFYLVHSPLFQEGIAKHGFSNALKTQEIEIIEHALVL